jgi:hypothetical protein
MSVGFPAAKSDLDSRAGSLVTGVRDSLYNAQRFSVLLQNDARFAAAALTALGYTSPEGTLLKAGFTDLANLYNIAHALGTQAVANDFFFNAGQLTGVV